MTNSDHAFETHPAPSDAAEVGAPKTPCSCGLESTQDERDWQILMSALVRLAQSGDLSPDPQFRPTPDQSVFDGVREDVSPAAEHALEPISAEWKQAVADEVDDIRAMIEVGVKELGLGYVGEDYDEVQDLIHQLSVFSSTVVDNATVVSEATSKAGELIATQQGYDNGRLPFPVPKFFVDPYWYLELFCEVAIHVRPAWHEGECQPLTPQEALAWAISDEAAAEEFVREIQLSIEDQMIFYESNGYDLVTAEAQSRQDAGAWLRDFVDQLRWDIYDAHIAVSQELITRVRDTESGLRQPDFDMQMARLPEIPGLDGIEPFPGLLLPIYGEVPGGSAGQIGLYAPGTSASILPVAPGSGGGATGPGMEDRNDFAGFLPGGRPAESGVEPVFPPTEPVGSVAAEDAWAMGREDGTEEGGLYGGMMMSPGGMGAAGGGGAAGSSAGGGLAAGGAVMGGGATRATPQARGTVAPPPPPMRAAGGKKVEEEEVPAELRYDAWLKEDDPWGNDDEDDEFR